jgi:NAD(P)-dependent dehydrogenase (short-subunit alcohol dehydrogenase family)
MSSTQSLSGRRIVITGATRGLGRALAITAADRGADLVLLGRSPTALTALIDTIRARTGRSCAHGLCDLSSPESIAKASEQILSAAPVLDVLINNACPWLVGDLEELQEEEIIATVMAGVAGTILITKHLLPGLRSSAAADIVTVVSTAGRPGTRAGIDASTVFHAVKHAQAGFHERLHVEVKKYGIRTAAIYPPDFEDVDPLGPGWDTAPRNHLTSRHVVEAILLSISPRLSGDPTIPLDANSADF